MRWEPAIYEHKAALIGRAVADVAYSAPLLAQALLAEYETYHAHFMTVGIDLYNIEAEALGAVVTHLGPQSCPEIQSPPWHLDALPPLALPPIPAAGRFSLIVEAAATARRAIPADVQLRVGVSGPITIAAKLVGLEDLIMGLAGQESDAIRLCDFCLNLSMAWCRHLRSLGFNVIIFDSAASPPNFSPDLYRNSIFPLHTTLIHAIHESSQRYSPLILGGNTLSILPWLCQTGATTLLCDYAVAAADFRNALPPDVALTIRRNISPQTLLDADDHDAQTFASDLAHFPAVIAGTGILPYNFPPARLCAFRQRVQALCPG